MENETSESNIKAFDITKLPITTNAFTWSFSASLLYIFLNVISLLIPTVMILTFYSFAMDSVFYHWRIFLIFLDIFSWWGAYILMSLVFGKLFLIILELIHKPKEGLFKANKNDSDYYYYCLRTAVKKYIFWVWNNFCFPWVSNFAFKICSMRTMNADFKSTMFDGWSDTEFIEYGNNIMIGQGAVVISSMIIRIDEEDYFLIKKVIIGDHVVLGGNAIVAPGTIIGHSTTLGVWAMTHIGQILEPYWIYVGHPASKYKRPQWYLNQQILEKARKEAQKIIDESKKPAVRRIVDTNERVQYDVHQHVRKDEDNRSS
jgi:carbonic anhydrase/acetyltransferase-like protein (isoleucine patch superfamily)